MNVSMPQPYLVVSITIISEAPSWGVPYDCHSDDSKGVILQSNMFIDRGHQRKENHVNKLNGSLGKV